MTIQHRKASVATALFFQMNTQQLGRLKQSCNSPQQGQPAQLGGWFIAPGDTLNLTASESWGSANSGSAALSGTTAGDGVSVTVTLTNKDSVASGDLVRLAILRDVDTDDASGDLTLWAVALYEET